MHSKVVVQTIKKQTKEGRAEGASLLDPGERGVGTPYATPNLDGKAGGSVERLQGSKHAAADAQTAEHLPQEGAIDRIIG